MTVSVGFGSYQTSDAAATECRVVYSSMDWTFLAIARSPARSFRSATVSDGVLIFLAMLMSSLRRGTPSVTFLAETPAKWKVFKVICVAGSPMDCAATVPMPSPGGASATLKRDSTSPMTQLNAAGDSLNSLMTLLALSVERTSAKNRMVEFLCASMESASRPGTTTRPLSMDLTLSMTCTAWSSSPPRLPPAALTSFTFP